MPPTWPHSTIRELLALALANGQSEAHLLSASEAKSFRFAIYYFRKDKDEFRDLSVTVEDNIVRVTQRPQPAVEIYSSPSL